MVVAIMMMGSVASAAFTVSSTDVPKVFVDNQPAGFTTSLEGPNLVITDLNLIFDQLLHTSVPDIHGELTSPQGTTVTFLKAFTESGILIGLGTPDNFVGTIFDDQAPMSLHNGAAPYTGSFNLNHALSGISRPFSVFDGENAAGTWRLSLSDRATADVGTLVAWSIQFTPEPVTLSMLTIAGLILARRRR